MTAKPKPPAAERLDSQRCPTCNTTSKRSLVVCIDGTSNQFSIRNTNVVELYSRLTKDEDQRTFYNSGIGTYAKPHGLTLRQWIANNLDLAIAWRFDRVLLSAYRWLSENYETGDRIFLFGFSRGAYQVRALSAMIRDVGLIHKGNQDQIPFAYKLYADPNSRQVSKFPLPMYESVKSYLYYMAGWKYPLRASARVNLVARFKESFSRKDVKVHFVGVWDTVSSVGFMYGKTLPGTTDGMEHTCFFRHALAIHERRVKFLPEFAGIPEDLPTHGSGNAARTTEGDTSRGRASSITEDGSVSDSIHALHEESLVSHDIQGNVPNVQGGDGAREHLSDAPLETPEPRIKEVWFVGCHSDIGGGNLPNVGDKKEFDADPRGPSLRWMSYESMIAGLNFGDDPQTWEDHSRLIAFQPYESLTWMWWILEILPMKRLSFLNSFKRDATVCRPHLGQWRRAFDDQKLHATALEVIGRDRLSANALNYLLQDQEANNASALSTPVRGESPLAAPPLHPAPTFGPDLRLWPDLEIEADPYYNALSFLSLLQLRGLTRESDVERLQMVLGNEAGRHSIRDAAEKLIDNDVRYNPDLNDDYGDDFDYKMRLKVEKSRGKVLSEWGSKLLYILQEWDEKGSAEWDKKGSAESVSNRALSTVFRLFEPMDARLSLRDSRELRRLAKSFATRGSWDSKNFLLLVNSVIPAALDFPLRDKNTCATFHPDGKRVLLGSLNANDCLVLDYSEMSPPRHLAIGKLDTVYLLAVSGDGTFVCVALRAKVASKSKAVGTSAENRPTCLPGCQTLPHHILTMTIWDTASPGDEPVRTIEKSPCLLSCLAFNHDGTCLVAGCTDGVAWTWADGWSKFATFPDDSIHSISWSRGSYVAVGSRAGLLSVWDMDAAPVPTILLTPIDVGTAVHCIAFDPKLILGTHAIRIVAGGSSGTFRLEIDYRVQVTKLSGLSTRCVGFSPDGKSIAAGLSSGMVRIWDADSCEPVCDNIHIPGDPTVLALSFEPDDTAVKAVCGDGLVRLLCWK